MCRMASPAVPGPGLSLDRVLGTCVCSHKRVKGRSHTVEKGRSHTVAPVCVGSWKFNKLSGIFYLLHMQHSFKFASSLLPAILWDLLPLLPLLVCRAGISSTLGYHGLICCSLCCMSSCSGLPLALLAYVVLLPARCGVYSIL